MLFTTSRSTPIRFLLPFVLMLLVPATSGAWQQHVHYEMNVTLDTARRAISGTQRLVYTNNSPDTLREVYYHLFWEAFRPGSMMDVRNRDLGGNFNIDQLPEDLQGRVRIGSMSQDGRALEWSVRETMLHADLASPLLPGDSTTLEITWESQVPKMIRRAGWMSKEGVEYTMTQWYPKIAAYDRHGWHPDVYVEREFYAPFGTFDVTVTLPASYVIASTGKVMNPEEVGCGYDWTGRDTIFQYPASGSGVKRWRLRAENVHDFAWSADREYVHQISRTPDVTIHLLYRRDVLPLWRRAAEFTEVIMNYYSSRFGRYAYDQFTVAQGGDGGMEYPAMVLILGRRSLGSLLQVISHELGHQWYYAMIGNNETRDAWMDEGFTTFIDNEAVNNLFIVHEDRRTGLARLVDTWDTTRWTNARPYYDLAIDGYDEPLTINHDRHREGSTASEVYFKGELILRQLEIILGQPRFDQAMKLYFERWKFRHPEPRDFERAMEDASGMRLDWFFQQWVGTTRKLDYAIDMMSSEQVAGRWRTSIALSNRNEANMPLVLDLLHADGTRSQAFVPVDDWKRSDIPINLPAWNWTARRYETTFETEKEIVEVEIDRTLHMGDIDRSNNVARSGFLSGILPASHVALFRRWDLDRPNDRYSIRLRPTLWYGHGDGAQIGFVADGGFTFDRYNAKAGIYYNLRSRRVDHDIRYATKGDFIGRLSDLSFLVTNSDGIQRWRAELGRDIRPFMHARGDRHYVSLAAEREVMFGPNYPHAAAAWDRGGYNWLELGYSYAANPSPPFRVVSASARFDASFASPTAFTQWQLRGSSGVSFLGLALDGAVAAGVSLGEPPAQHLFDPAGSTSREKHLNEIQRLANNIDPEWSRRNRLVLPGDGMLMAFAGEDTRGRLSANLVNARLSLGNLNPFASLLRLTFLDRIDLRAYAAAGWIPGDRMAVDRFDRTAIEAGISLAITPMSLLFPDTFVDLLSSPRPIRLSATLPLYARSPLLPDNPPRRWAIGITVE